MGFEIESTKVLNTLFSTNAGKHEMTGITTFCDIQVQYRILILIIHLPIFVQVLLNLWRYPYLLTS